MFKWIKVPFRHFFVPASHEYSPSLAHNVSIKIFLKSSQRFSCSIVHSEEEIAGSYNWDYLLDWGPQYQPLANVFQEISALKDEGVEGMVGGMESRAPPIITCRPPRHVHAVQSTSSHPARSPISHEMLSQSAMSPSFSPALSPLATRSPSISPLGGPVRQGMARGMVQQSHYQHNLPSDYGEAADKEMRI